MQLDRLRTQLQQLNLADQGEHYAATWQEFMGSLAQLEQQRAAAQRLELDAAAAIGYYNRLNGQLLETVDSLARVRIAHELSGIV